MVLIVLSLYLSSFLIKHVLLTYSSTWSIVQLSFGQERTLRYVSFSYLEKTVWIVNENWLCGHLVCYGYGALFELFIAVRPWTWTWWIPSLNITIGLNYFFFLNFYYCVCHSYTVFSLVFYYSIIFIILLYMVHVFLDLAVAFLTISDN